MSSSTSASFSSPSLTTSAPSSSQSTANNEPQKGMGPTNTIYIGIAVILGVLIVLASFSRRRTLLSRRNVPLVDNRTEGTRQERPILYERYTGDAAMDRWKYTIPLSATLLHVTDTLTEPKSGEFPILSSDVKNGTKLDETSDIVEVAVMIVMPSPPPFVSQNTTLRVGIEGTSLLPSNPRSLPEYQIGVTVLLLQTE
ncbi:hypothetical protein CPB84DRAFT_1323182 [Gymnopilus junonius]|uniref:Uncharacterized protein n=1 Tax=Gymnopilus junonius TaxID=109634 RepID=A0A9P5TM98_GYMJU|nr:hypothetical protein CPB84DRAFT_1323182 [Gymnopilus junonius]